MFEETINAIRDNADIASLFSYSDWLSTELAGLDAERREQLWELGTDVYGLNADKEFARRFDVLSTYPELLEVLTFLIGHLDWSEGIPMTILQQDVLGSAVPSVLRYEILQYIATHQIPVSKNFLQILEPITRESNLQLANLALAIRSEPLIEWAKDGVYKEQMQDLESITAQTILDLSDPSLEEGYDEN